MVLLISEIILICIFPWMCLDFSWGICLQCSQIVAKWVTSRLVNLANLLGHTEKEGRWDQKSWQVGSSSILNKVVERTWLLVDPQAGLGPSEMPHSLSRPWNTFSACDFHHHQSPLGSSTRWIRVPTRTAAPDTWTWQTLHRSAAHNTSNLMAVAACAWSLCKAAMPSTSFWGAENYRTLGELYQRRVESLCLRAQPPMHPFFDQKNKLFLCFWSDLSLLLLSPVTLGRWTLAAAQLRRVGNISTCMLSHSGLCDTMD